MTHFKSHHDPVAINDCLRDSDFAVLLSVGGDKVEDVYVYCADAAEKKYTLGVKLKRREQVFYLSTAREPGKPRKFKTIETAISVGKQFYQLGQPMIFRVVINTASS
jgi:hypothetical protein